jgi:hypothetical protein
MAEFLFTIQETYGFESVGLIVAVDIKIKDAKLKKGDEIELRRAEGLPLITKVESIPMINPHDPEQLFSFSLPEGINKEDVPVGTEVWSHP